VNKKKYYIGLGLIVNQSINDTVAFLGLLSGTKRNDVMVRHGNVIATMLKPGYLGTAQETTF